MTRATDFNLSSQCVLNIPLFEGIGLSYVKDDAPAHHPVQMIHSPTWVQLSSGVWVLDFDGTNDYLNIATAFAGDLKMSSAPGSTGFSGCAWVYADLITNMRAIIGCCGAWDTAGWGLFIDSGSNRGVTLYRHGGDHKYAFTGEGTYAAYQSAWCLVGFSYRAASAPYTMIFFNGLNYPLQYGQDGVYVPVTNAYEFRMAWDREGSSKYDGKMGGQRVWQRWVSPAEHMQIFNAEREFFGV